MGKCLPFTECRYSQIVKDDGEYVANNYNPFPVIIVKGEGSWVWDSGDNRYLDMFGSYAVHSFGHRHPRIVAAACRQMEKITVTSGMVHSENRGEFAKNLAELCGLDRVLCSSNTGVEAVEKGIKIARKWGYRIKGIPKDKAEIIVCENNFHGRTITVVSFSTVDQYQDGFGPLTPGFKVIPFGEVKALKDAIDDNTAAFLVEPVQGESGVNIPPEGYLREAKEICEKNRILLVTDEIQTGMGRTGKNFCYMHEEITPDMTFVGKALGGGILPVSAVVAKKEVMDVIGYGDDGSTFGGNPLACAVAIEAMKVLVEENLAFKATKKGGYLMSCLRAISSPHVKEVRGKGLLVGMELREGNAKDFCLRLLKKGVLAGYTREKVVRFSPPLTSTYDELTVGADAVRKVLETY